MQPETLPALMTFSTDAETGVDHDVRNAMRGPTGLTAFLLGRAVDKLVDDHEDPLRIQVGLGVGNLAVTVAAFATNRRLDSDAPTPLVGVVGIGTLAREGDIIKLSYQRPRVGIRPPSYHGITFREHMTPEGQTVWFPEKIWALGDQGEPVLVDCPEYRETDPPYYEGRPIEVLAAPLPKASLAMHNGVVDMSKPGIVPLRYSTDISLDI